MDTNEYLNAILDDQILSQDSTEMEELRAVREELDGIIRKEFGKELTVRYGGSKAKNTMIRESYDLDVVCYFPHDSTIAGDSLKEIFQAVHNTLTAHYFVEPKTSALRVMRNGQDRKDLHVDVVPGRYVDDEESDVFLHQSNSDKDYLKTNLDIHIEHIRESQLTDAIRLMKLWKVRRGLNIKTFVLELLVVELLRSAKSKSLDEQLILFWSTLREDIDSVSVEDPANPTGNDLSLLLDQSKRGLQVAAETTIQDIEVSGWRAVFGDPVGSEQFEQRTDVIKAIPSARPSGAKPWSW